MFGFLLKKTFFDLWDNLFKIILLNLGFVASLAITLFLPGLLEPPGSMLAAGMGMLWGSVYLSAAARLTGKLSDYRSFGFADFLPALKWAWPGGIVTGFFALFVYVLAAAVIPFYLRMNSAAGLLLAAFVFWTLAALVLSLQFFFAVRSRMDSRIAGALKRSFFVFLGSPGFCLLCFFQGALVLALSAFLFFLFPGPAGLLLYLDEALRLRLLKYRWLASITGTEAGTKAGWRRRIPWDDLLAEDREKTGNRSLRNVIFPWKD